MRRALRELQGNGEGSLDGFMRAGITEKMLEVKEDLKSKAGALANVRVPATLGYGKSTNIHVKDANALKVHRIEKMRYMVQTGKSIQEVTPNPSGLQSLISAGAGLAGIYRTLNPVQRG